MYRLLTIGSGILMGAFLGVLFGVVLWALLAPNVSAPRQHDRHEWYPMVMYLNAMWSVIGGGILGLIVGSLPTRRVAGSASAGLLIGLVVGYAAWDQGAMGGKERDPYFATTIIWFTFLLGTAGSIVGGVWSLASKPTDLLPPGSEASWFHIAPFLVACVIAILLWCWTLQFCLPPGTWNAS